MGQRAVAHSERRFSAARRIPHGDIILVGILAATILLLLLSSRVNGQPLSTTSPLTPLARLMDIFALGCLLLLAHALGARLLNGLAITLPGIEGAAIACTLGLGLLASLLLALGFVGLYRPAVIIILLVSLAIILRQSLYRTGKELSRTVARAPRWLNSTQLGKLPVALFCLCGSALFLSLLGALTPPHHHDPLTYHLPLPQRFLQTGIVGPVDDIIASDLPLTVELLFGIGLTWGSAPFAALLHLAFGGLTAAMTWGAARRWFDRTTAWLALALFLGTPLVVVWARVANNDIAVACFLLAALIVALHPQTHPTANGSWRAVAVAGLFAGFALGTKYQAAPAVPPVGLWLFFSAWRAGEGSRWSPQRWWQGVRVLLIFGGVIAVVIAPWYIRNIKLLLALLQILIDIARPASSALNDPNQGTYLVQGLTISPRTPLGYLLLPIRSYIRGDFEQRYVVLNPLFLLLPALLATPIVWHHRALQVALAMAGAFSMVWALGVQELRYLLAVCPMFAIGTACLLRYGWERRSLRPVVGGGLVATALLTLILTFLHVGADRPLAVTLGIESRDSYLRQSAAFGSTYRATSFLTNNLASGEQALFVNEVQTYYLPDGKTAPTVGARGVIHTLVSQYATPQEAVEALRAQHITYILVNDADLRWWMQGDTSGYLFKERQSFNQITDQLTLVYQDGPTDRPNITIYRVPDAGAR